MKKEAFVIDRQFANSDNKAEISGRALNDISLGDRLSIVKENGISVYIVQKLEAYRKSIEIACNIWRHNLAAIVKRLRVRFQ